MLRDPKDGLRLEPFLANWEAEIRAGYSPVDESNLEERFGDYLGEYLDPEIEHHLLETLRDHTRRFVAAQQTEEATWVHPTTNDRITAAFRHLAGEGVLAMEGPGLTIRDG